MYHILLSEVNIICIDCTCVCVIVITRLIVGISKYELDPVFLEILFSIFFVLIVYRLSVCVRGLGNKDHFSIFSQLIDPTFSLN